MRLSFKLCLNRRDGACAKRIAIASLHLSVVIVTHDC